MHHAQFQRWTLPKVASLASAAEKVFLQPSAWRAALGAGAGGVAEWRLNSGHDTLAQVVGAGQGAISGGMAGYNPRLLGNKLFMAGTTASLAIPRALEHLTLGNELLNQEIQKNNQQPPQESWLARHPEVALGAGALALGGAGLWSWARRPAAQTNVVVGGSGGGGRAPMLDGGMGTLKVTLPTRHAKDHETVVELPLEQVGLPKTIYDKIRRDTKRRLRSETEERTIHRHLADAIPEVQKVAARILCPVL